ncbi:MAG: hypothetical protein OEP48_09095 [Betaproteobacteria bacterium]|nr:hypothetical protein [Betaproteobacteria bacterium]MDH3435938.1 hypothetical protein [Betaproteobacteria bacterium]
MSGSYLLTSPNAIGLPAAERGDAPAPAASAVVEEWWPQIERLLADGQASAAICSMEALAVEMRRATVGDAPLFRDALTLARRVLYDDLAQVGRTAECEEPTRAALYRCATWDEELRPYLEQLISS